MATTRGRRTTRKKKAEVVEESPKVEEVIEPKAEEPAPEPVQEELPPPPPPVKEPKDKEPPAPAPEPVQEAPVLKEEKKSSMGVGSEVRLPSGKKGRIISLEKRGRFKVQRLDNPKKVYVYDSNSLTLVK